MEQLQMQLNQYCVNYALCVRLSRNWLDASGSDAELIEDIQQRSETIAALMAENDGILRKSLFPVLDRPEPSFAPEEEQILSSFAEKMIDRRGTLDVRLGLRVFQALLKHAQASGNSEAILSRLYQCGMAYFGSLYSQELAAATWEPNPYFQQMETFLPQYDTLSDAGRSLLLRGMHNRSLRYPLYSREGVENYLAMLEQERQLFAEKREMNPEFPWETFENARKRQILRVLVSIRMGIGVEYAPMLVETMRGLPDKVLYIDENGKTSGQVQLQCQYVIARYHAGQITCRHLTDELQRIYDSVDRLDTSVDGIAKNMKLPAYLLYYLGQDASRTEAEKIRAAEEVYHSLNAYMEAYDFGGSNEQFMNEVNNLLSAFREGNFDREYPEWVPRLMRLVHLPTYIHSEMVALLSAAIASFAAEYRPQWLEDCSDRNSFVDFVYRAAFLHDIGKLCVLEVVAQYSRRLFDEEFETLKLHPVYGYRELMFHSASQPYAQVALCHHLSHDGRSGYPADPAADPSSCRLAVDIVHIADCIDAATDDIGRCYARAKSLDALLEEMTGMGESQYHMGILELLRHPVLHARIEQILDRQRKDLYVRNYRDISRRSRQK